MLELLTFADAFFRGISLSHYHVWTNALHCYCTYRFGSSISIANVRASRESSATFRTPLGLVTAASEVSLDIRGSRP